MDTRVGLPARIEVIAAAATAAAGTASMLRTYHWGLPIAVAAFVAIACPVLARNPDHFRTACGIIAGCLLFACFAGLLALWFYIVFFAMPALITGIAMTVPARRATAVPDSVSPWSRGVLVLIATSVSGAFVALALRGAPVPIGWAGWGALALLPALIPGRWGVRATGVAAGIGLLAVYVSQPIMMPVLAAGVAVVLVCCDDSAPTRVVALVATGAGWLPPLLMFLS